MADLNKDPFDAATFSIERWTGEKNRRVQAKADFIFYLQKGRAKITVVSKNGKEATIALLSAGDFVGEESLATVGGLRLTTATSITNCTALKIERGGMVPSPTCF